jgi:hypothetical protein
MKLLSLVILLFAALALAQKAAPAKPEQPEPFPVRVFGPPWEAGELRTCSTYWKFTDFLLCDDGVRDKILDATIQKGDPEHLLIAIQTAPPSKKFLVQFSKLPWKLAPPDPDKKSDEPVFANPDYRSANMESRWDCTKDKTITCKFAASF